MKFMLMMNHPGKLPYQVTNWAPSELKAHIAFMQSFATKLQERGELVAAEGLSGPEQAKLVTAAPDGEPITDGIFPEAKEFLAGYWIIDVASAEAAYAIAAQASLAPGPGGKPLFLPIEVRQVMSAPPSE
jgi:hypothetical protein